MKDTLVIYHADCPDGFGAAYAAWLALKDAADYLPCWHGGPVPEVRGKEVFILDFSFERGVIARMAAEARSLTLLDHHRTAFDTLRDLACGAGVSLFFDLGKSGARLAWEHFHPGQPAPYLIERIEDRDLWKWQFADSRDFMMVLDSRGFDFGAWQLLRQQSEDPDARAALLKEGAVLRQQFERLVESAARDAFALTLLGHPTLAVNAQGEFGSELGSLLSQRTGTFAVVFRIESPDFVKVSLRSQPGFDVASLALQFGGGGHPQASAFRLPMAKFAAFLGGSLTGS